MQDTPQFVEAVDAFLAAPKILVGAASQVRWQAGRDFDERRLRFPLEIDGEQMGHTLLICTYPESMHLRFLLSLEFLGTWGVSRLDFDPMAKHANNFQQRSFKTPMVIHGPHWHSWGVNRDSLGPISHPLRLRNAIPFKEASKFDAALRWFCAEHQIELGHHGIVYPPKTRLI